MRTRMVTLQALNLLGFGVMVAVNYAANALPLNDLSTKELSSLYPSLFTPAGFTFSIWGLIYLSLLGFCIYQASGLLSRPRGRNMLFLHDIGYWFFVSCLLNAGWIFAWHYTHVLLSLAIMVALLLVLIRIYLNLGVGDGTTSFAQNLWVHVPFRLYLGWVTIATIANVSALLVHVGWNRWGLSEVFWTVVMIIAATLLTVGFLILRRDLVVSLVSLWALFGIAAERMAAAEPAAMTVAFSSIVAMGVIGILAVWIASRQRRQGVQPLGSASG